MWLAQQLLAAQAGSATLSSCAKDYIESHIWPGNVRELKSALLQACAFAPANHLQRAHFSQPLLLDLTTPQRQPTKHAAQISDVRPRNLLLREAVDDALRVTNGNLSEAARRLKIARSTLYRILHRDAAPRESKSPQDSAE